MELQRVLQRADRVYRRTERRAMARAFVPTANVRPYQGKGSCGEDIFSSPERHQCDSCAFRLPSLAEQDLEGICSRRGTPELQDSAAPREVFEQPRESVCVSSNEALLSREGSGVTATSGAESCARISPLPREVGRATPGFKRTDAPLIYDGSSTEEDQSPSGREAEDPEELQDQSSEEEDDLTRHTRNRPQSGTGLVLTHFSGTGQDGGDTGQSPAVSPTPIETMLDSGRGRDKVGQHRCSHCAGDFETRRRLRHHINLYHSTQDRVDRYKAEFSFHCSHDGCDQMFSTERGLKNHTAMQHKGRSVGRYECAECTKRFEHKSEWKYHRSRAHRGKADDGPEESFPFACMIEGCNRRFMTKGGMLTHTGVHDQGEPRFRCGVCPQRFRSIRDLREHTSVTHLTAGERVDRDDSDVQTEVDEEGAGEETSTSLLSFTGGVDGRNGTSTSSRSARMAVFFKRGYSMARYHDGARSFGRQQSGRVVVTRYKTADEHEAALQVGQGDDNSEQSDESADRRVHEEFLTVFHPRKARTIYDYQLGRPLPNKDFQGLLRVPLWDCVYTLEVAPYSIRMPRGGSLYVFEIPRGLFMEVVGRAEDITRPAGETLSAVRYGPRLGIVLGGLRSDDKEAHMRPDVDYQQGLESYVEALEFLLCDVYTGTRQNDTAHVFISRNFLW